MISIVLKNIRDGLKIFQKYRENLFLKIPAGFSKLRREKADARRDLFFALQRPLTRLEQDCFQFWNILEPL